MSLTTGELNHLMVEEQAERLWYEWLNRYFDGASHAVNGEDDPVPFPAVSFGFGQSPPPQPVDADLSQPGLVFQITVMKSGMAMADKDTEGDDAVNRDTIWQIMVACSDGAEAGGGNARYLCRQAADLLIGLLNNRTETLDLAAKGMTQLRASAGTPVSSKEYQLRRVLVSCRMEWVQPV